MNKSITDIIIPIYGDLGATTECIESVLKYQDKSQRIVLINDKSPEPKINKYLRKISKGKSGVILIEHKINQGFVKTVNEGMSLSKENDVILLNSDTIVSQNWVSKMRETAYQSCKIGTVTAFSNSASVFSYPVPNTYNNLPEGYEIEDINKIFESKSCNQPLIEIPTGHGFCMFIKREAIKRVGLFNEKVFGKGYGEENDFSQRLKLSGYINTVCWGCYIFHKEGSSFIKNSKREKRKQKALERVLRLHPRYLKEINEFIEEDPFRGFRALIDYEIIKVSPKNKILFIQHNWGGGTKKSVEEITESSIINGWIPLVIEPEGTGFILSSPYFYNLKLFFNGENSYKELLAVLRSLGINHIHYHHLVGIDNRILNIPKDLNLSYDFTLHDYYMVCPRINLLNNKNNYCNANTNESICNKCLMSQNTIGLWRKKNLNFLKSARRVFSPSKACALIYKKYFPELKIKVIPHPFPDYRGKVKRREIREKVKVAIIGSIGVHKGFNVIKDCSNYSKINNLPIEWIIIGSTENDIALKNAVITGKFETREELRKRLLDYRIDLVLFPSIWPETFSYVISEAWDSGIPVLTLDIGAQGERVNETGAGWTIKKLTPKNVCEKILEIKNDRESYKFALKNIKKFKPRTEFNWNAYFGDLIIGKTLKCNIPDDIITRASKSYRIIELKNKINYLEKENNILCGMYFSSEQKYQTISNSRIWKLRNKIARRIGRGEI